MAEGEEVEEERRKDGDESSSKEEEEEVEVGRRTKEEKFKLEKKNEKINFQNLTLGLNNEFCSLIE